MCVSTAIKQDGHRPGAAYVPQDHFAICNSSIQLSHSPHSLNKKPGRKSPAQNSLNSAKNPQTLLQGPCPLLLPSCHWGKVWAFLAGEAPNLCPYKV